MFSPVLFVLKVHAAASVPAIMPDVPHFADRATVASKRQLRKPPALCHQRIFGFGSAGIRFLAVTSDGAGYGGNENRLTYHTLPVFGNLRHDTAR